MPSDRAQHDRGRCPTAMKSIASRDDLSAAQSPERPPYVVGVVVLVAVAWGMVAFFAHNLWLQPDSWESMQLAGQLVDGRGFVDERFLVRPPGYPLFLATMFRVFGEHSPIAIVALQQAMIVGVNILVTLLTWHLSKHASVALLTGLMSACSLHLPALAGAALTEAPFTLLFMASVYFLVRYHTEGGARLIALSSLFAGFAYLVRPMGLTIVAVCAVVVLHRVWLAMAAITPTSYGDPMRRPNMVGRLWRVRRQAVTHLLLAVVPGVVCMVAWQSHLVAVHQTSRAWGCFSGIVLYHRAVAVEKLDAPTSEALARTKLVVAKAKAEGLIHPGIDNTRWYTVWQALHDVEGMTLPEAGVVMAEAGRDVIAAHPGLLARRTLKHLARTLLMPEGSYRYVPGGVPGDGWKQAKDADLLEASMFESLLRPRIEPYNHYIPLKSEPGPTTPVWSAVARWYYRNIECGRSILGIGDTPYEAFVYLCMMGGLLSLTTRQRMTWLLLALVIASQVVPSAVLAGTISRYGVPTHPLMKAFAALAICLAIRAVCISITRVRNHLAKQSSGEHRVEKTMPFG